MPFDKPKKLKNFKSLPKGTDTPLSTDFECAATAVTCTLDQAQNEFFQLTQIILLRKFLTLKLIELVLCAFFFLFKNWTLKYRTKILELSK